MENQNQQIAQEELEKLVHSLRVSGIKYNHMYDSHFPSVDVRLSLCSFVMRLK